MLRADKQLTSYADMVEYFRKVKTPSKGRPLKQGVRLYQEGKTFVVKMYNWQRGEEVPWFKVTPKNVVTFLIPLKDVLLSSHGLVILLPRIVPVFLCRARKGIYQIAGEKAMIMKPSRWGNDYPDWTHYRKTAPEYFKGIKFDLLTGECLNPQPDQATTELPAQRKVWRSELRRYKRGLKARAKVGALRGFIDEERVAIRAAKSVWQYRRKVCPKWTEPEWADLLIKSMKKEKYPAEILQAFVRSTYSNSFASDGTTEELILKAVDQVFTQNSEHLRRKYGVFGKTLHMKS